jgi:ribonuclease HI
MQNCDTSIIYTDGSCLQNPDGPSGWCCCIVEESKLWILSDGEISSTNNRMELTAINEALSICPTPKCIIYTDSKLTLNCARGIWKRKANLDLWNIFDINSKNIFIEWEWVKSHKNNVINNLVDEIARKEAREIKKLKK